MSAAPASTPVVAPIFLGGIQETWIVVFGCSPIGVAIRGTASGFVALQSEEPGSAAASRSNLGT